jgi:hypothetical protein
MQNFDYTIGEDGLKKMLEIGQIPQQVIDINNIKSKINQEEEDRINRFFNRGWVMVWFLVGLGTLSLLHFHWLLYDNKVGIEHWHILLLIGELFVLSIFTINVLSKVARADKESKSDKVDKNEDHKMLQDELIKALLKKAIDGVKI